MKAQYLILMLLNVILLHTYEIRAENKWTEVISLKHKEMIKLYNKGAEQSEDIEAKVVDNEEVDNEEVDNEEVDNEEVDNEEVDNEEVNRDEEGVADRDRDRDTTEGLKSLIDQSANQTQKAQCKVNLRRKRSFVDDNLPGRKEVKGAKIGLHGKLRVYQKVSRLS
jgi:hypothetical protein